MGFGMLYATQNFAKAAGFETAAKLTNEMHRNDITLGEGIRVGPSKRYGIVSLAKAIVMGTLREFQVPVTQHREVIHCIDEHALACALDQFENGDVQCVLLLIPSWQRFGEFPLVYVNRIEAAEAMCEQDYILVNLDHSIRTLQPGAF